MTAPPSPATRRPLLASRHGALTPARSRSRVSAFVYGNITALGAVLSVDAADTTPWRGALVVGVTCVTTFAAHVLSDAVSAGIGVPDADPDSDRGTDPDTVRHHLLQELRDAVPVATSGVVPVLLLLLAGAGDLSLAVALVVAAGELVVRLAGTGMVVARLTDRPASAGTVWWGAAVAVLCALVAGTKAAFGH